MATNATAGDTDRPTAREAFQAIREMVAYDDPLRRRTEGVTWMVWGLVTSTFMLTQAALGEAVPWEVWLFVWLPGWLGVGVLGTEMVWRIASLSRAALAPIARKTGIAFVLGALTFSLLMVVVYPFSGPSYTPQLVTVLVLPWVFLAAVQWRRLTDAGRKFTVVLAVVILAVGAAVVLARGPFDSSSGALTVALVAGGLPFAAGTWWALRG